MGLCEGAAAGVGAQAASWARAAALGGSGGLVVVVMLSRTPTGLGPRLRHDAVDGAMVETDARAV